MIRYRITRNELITAIDNQDSTWRSEASLRLGAFRSAGTYNDELLIPDGSGGTKKASAIWSRIKPVYMRIQHEKCAYCERQLSAEEWGRGEHDLEHYRPKKNAKPWTVPSGLSGEGFSLTLPQQGTSDPGYHLLSYHVANYCAACKPCNSGLKRDEFPIEGTRDSSGDNPNQMNSEHALLLFPIGLGDDDPEELIDFFGLVPRAKSTHGRRRRRALATIAFFELNNPNRKELFRERARLITSVYGFLLHRNQVGDTWDQLIAVWQESRSPHANCVRSFVRLFESDRPEADGIFDQATAFLASIS